MILDLCYKSRGFLAADGFALTKFTDQVLAGLIDKAKNRPQRLFATVFGIMPFAASLLVAENCLHRRIDTDTDFIIINIAKLPNSLAQGADNIYK